MGSIVLIILLSFSNTAECQGAKEFYSKGVEAFDAGKFDEAADAFRKAFELKPSWKIFFNIGQSEAAAKRYGMAWESFELYLVEGGDDIPEERKDYIISEIQRMKLLVGFVKVTAPDGIDVIVDTELRGTTPLKGDVRIAAGSHKIVLRKGIDALLEKEISVIGGITSEIKYEPKEDAAPVPAPVAEPKPEQEPEPEQKPEEQPEEEEDGIGLDTWGWIALGVGGGVLIGGAITGGMALSTNGQIMDDYPDGNVPPEGQDDVDKRDTLATVSTVMIISGAAIAATGAGLLIYDAFFNSGEESAVSLAPGPTSISLVLRY